LRLKVDLHEQMAAFAAAEQRDGAGWITTIGVAPAFRRQGIGRALLAACEQRLGAARMRLCVRRDNPPAQRMYWQAGYLQVDVWKSYYRDGEDAFVLEKKL
jgi:ribosomal protein S18 acetylase RimI-like enzyme